MAQCKIISAWRCELAGGCSDRYELVELDCSDIDAAISRSLGHFIKRGPSDVHRCTPCDANCRYVQRYKSLITVALHACTLYFSFARMPPHSDSLNLIATRSNAKHPPCHSPQNASSAHAIPNARHPGKAVPSSAALECQTVSSCLRLASARAALLT